MEPGQLTTIDRIENTFPRLRSLVYGYILLLFLFIAAVLPVLDHFQINKFFQILIIDFSCALWTSVFFYHRYKLPKNKPGKIGIILSIITENNNQKIRYRNDLIKRIRDLSSQDGLMNDIEVLPLSNFQAQNVSSRLDSYRNLKIQNKLDKETVDKLNSLHNKTNGYLYIWGNIKERNDQGKKYFFEINALVFHAPVKEEVEKLLNKDITSAWLPVFNFDKSNEYLGFSISASLIYISAEYILGLAAFVSYDLQLALDLHKACKKKIDAFKPKTSNLIEMGKNLNGLIKDEIVFLSIQKYNTGDRKGARSLLKELMDNQPDLYDAYVLKSVLDYRDGNKEDSYKAIERAERIIGPSGGVHQYNKAFLLMVLDKHKEALRIYRNISINKFPREENVVKEVISFLKDQLKLHEEIFAINFVIGFIEYKKNKNYSAALKYFNKFMDLTDGNLTYRYLRIYATKYLNELKRKSSNLIR